jgi:hypothetical protein
MEYVVGQPARFRLEMKNFGKKVRAYDRGGVERDVVIMTGGPGGKPVRFIGPGGYQTHSSAEYIVPGETKILFDELDLTKQHLLSKPGSYTLRFAGTELAFPVESKIPPSAKITIQMRPKPLPSGEKK